MKTFSEYIGQASLLESRQKYIFGGTDDRNTTIKDKTFRELEVGDKFYYWSVSEDTVNEFTLDKKAYIKSDEFRLGYNGGAYYYGYAKDIDSVYSCSKVGAWVITTSFEEMCRIAKEEFNTILDDKNLKEC